MLLEPNCSTRGCKHYLGVIDKSPENDTDKKVSASGHINYCKAFLNGIPKRITYGNVKHLKPIKEQKNNIIFEKEE